MAKIVVAGEAVIITSSIKFDDLKMVEKYRPEALILKGGDDGKKPLFAIATNAVGSFNRSGIEFNSSTRDDDKLASVTLYYKGDDNDDIVEKIVDQLGSAIMSLNKIEAALPDVIAEINSEREAVRSGITIAQ